MKAKFKWFTTTYGLFIGLASILLLNIREANYILSNRFTLKILWPEMILLNGKIPQNKIKTHLK